ncbi:unnamed protein product, partial [Phaeothamnion confervicola]
MSSPIPISVLNGSGRYKHSFTDLAIPTRGLPLVLSRIYSSDQQKTAPRFGWDWSFQDRLTIEPNSGTVFHIQPGNVVHAFTNSGGVFTPTESEVTDKLTQIDDHHYQILTKSKMRMIYEVPSGVTVSATVPFEAPVHQQIDRNDNANTFTWDAQGKRLARIEGPDPSQYLKFTWTNDRGPDKVFDHTGRCVVYGYQS